VFNCFLVITRCEDRIGMNTNSTFETDSKTVFRFVVIGLMLLFWVTGKSFRKSDLLGRPLFRTWQLFRALLYMPSESFERRAIWFRILWFTEAGGKTRECVLREAQLGA
jgi:hypothetical protein